jgi:predicted Zn-dependent protease
MTPLLRRSRLAVAALSALVALAMQAQPQTQSAPPALPGAASPAPVTEPATPAAATGAEKQEAAQPSAMTAELFYEVLIGEIEARGNNPGSGYDLILDAARRSHDDKLFQRAVELALQSRSGDAALRAARAWKDANPESLDARRFELQILIALNRIGETLDPLRAVVAATPQTERPTLMLAITRNYVRATDKKLAASVVERALVDELKSPATGSTAWSVVGRLRLTSGDRAGALEAAIKGQEMDPAAEEPVFLALGLIVPPQPQAEAIVKRYLADPKARPDMRIAYARTLAENRREADAITELTKLTETQPGLPIPWLLLGSLQAQARQNAAAEASISRYISLTNAQSQDQNNQDAKNQGLNQAYLLMSQLAERRKDFSAADNWLTRVDNPDDPLSTPIRRAGLLARQGKVPQALKLVRGLPEHTASEKKQKLFAEVQLLRDAKQYQAAFDMLGQASAAEPNDTDLLYDQAMVAEKLNRLDEMERLLRRMIALKPDNQSAYNALGYSFADRNIRLEEAKTLIQKAAQLAPDDSFIADSLGWVEFRLGNMAEAVRILEDAYKRQPDPEIGAHLGEVLWTLGQRERALAIWKEATLAGSEDETLRETLKRLGVKL